MSFTKGITKQSAKTFLMNQVTGNTISLTLPLETLLAPRIQLAKRCQPNEYLG